MIRRKIEALLRAAMRDTPVVLLNGARQTGKSTLAIAIADELSAAYITLDDATAHAAAVNDPQGFISGLSETTVIDEIQKAPNLLPAIKAAVDRNRRPGRFLLTGSANIFLLPNVSESLAGRMEILTLWPLSVDEQLNRENQFIENLFAAKLPRLAPSDDNIGLLDMILKGGYPEVIQRADEQRRQAWFASYITAILQRDVRDLSNIEGLVDMPRLLSLLGSRVSGLLNTSELSRSTGIPNTTLKRYLTLLQATFLLQPLPAWSSNLGKRLIKSSKVHLVDSGLTAYLAGETTQRFNQGFGSIGPLLETFVISELRKQATWAKTRVNLHHYRTTTGQEVDTVLENAAGKIVGVEIKAATTITRKDFFGLETLAADSGKRFVRGVILCNVAQPIPFGENYHALPISALWRG